MAKQCELIIGYLLPRRCEEKASHKCTNCGRTACEPHTRIGDAGLLCRDCFEKGQPFTPEALESLPTPVQKQIYSRWDSIPDTMDDDDFLAFDSEEEADSFSMLS